MRSDVKAKWVQALRSGEYQQTVGLLHRVVDGNTDGSTNPDAGLQVGFCCLGVLCEVAVKDGVISATHKDGGHFVLYGKEGISMLPEKVQQWAGLTSLGTYEDNGETRSLAELNDHDRLNFNQIADVVERKF